MVLNAPGDHHFRAILDVMGRSDLKDDPRFLTRSTRVANFAAVDELIESWTRTLTKYDVARRMLAAAVPCAPVRDLAEVMHDENMHARGSLQWIDHPDLGRVVLPHSPLVFEGTERRPIEPSLPLAPATRLCSAIGLVIRGKSWRLTRRKESSDWARLRRTWQERGASRS